MKRFLLPLVGILAAAGATASIARTAPRRQATTPPVAPPEPDFARTVAAIGLVEASTENLSIGTALGGVVDHVDVVAGQTVQAGDPLFRLDTRHLRADLAVRVKAQAVAAAEVAVGRARLEDAERQLGFVESVKDERAITREEATRRRSAVETARAELQAAEARVAAAAAGAEATRTEIERSTVRAPIQGEVLQVKLRPGEFAAPGPSATPMILLGRLRPLHVRVDVDEQEAWRVRPDATAKGHLRGNAALETPLGFVRVEPFVVPKRSLTGDSTERVDTRVLQVIYRVERDDLPLHVGQQLDVFIDAGAVRPEAHQ